LRNLCCISLYCYFSLCIDVFLRSDLFSPDFPRSLHGHRPAFAVFSVHFLTRAAGQFCTPIRVSSLPFSLVEAPSADICCCPGCFLASAPAKRVLVLDSSVAAQAAGNFFPSLISVFACHHLHSRDLFFPFVRSGVVSTRKEFSRGVSLCLAVRNH
jgi:hypothetical protein